MSVGIRDRIGRRGLVLSIYRLIKGLFQKYRKDNGNLIVASISFYVLLTSIPLTLLSLFILGFVIDISSPGMHIEKLVRNILPNPYNTIIIKRFLRELNMISLSKNLSGPLGLIFLFFFTSKLFTVMRPVFRNMFGVAPEGFFKAKGRELLFTLIFSFVQTVLFFSFLFGVLIKTKIAGLLPSYLSAGVFPVIQLSLDFATAFFMFYSLYLLLIPVKGSKKLLVFTGFLATLLWNAGKSLFKYYILHALKYAAFLGTYGIFIAFLFWIYYSVFVFIVCAELHYLLLKELKGEPLPS